MILGTTYPPFSSFGVDLFRMGGNRFSIVDFVGSVLESIEHTVQLISELGTLLHCFLKGLHSFPKADLKIIVPLVISFNDILYSVGKKGR